MVDYKYAKLYTQDSIDKQVKIEYDGGTTTNEELFFETIELTESLCSEPELRFGCCEASVLKFKIANIMTSLYGQWLSVSETLAGNTDAAFLLGRYKVYSDKPTADRRYREIVAYDAMYDIINADVADWYNAILPDKTSTVTLKKFRTSFLEHLGLEQEEAELVNDDMIVEKTIEPSEISGKDVITAICELNGCFGHIGRDGKFKCVFLEKYIDGLYPANDLYPADDLYPRDSNANKVGNHLYISCKYEDFVTQRIDKLQIRQEENDIGAIVGTGTNCYIVEDNFLVYGKTAKELGQIADNLFGIITEISYRPFEAECKGNPCFEVGDAVRLATKYEIVESYILKRTLKGIQALRDTYIAEGVMEYSEKVNSVNKSIIQLKGKTNTLERTVEETKATIADVEKNMQTQITQTAESISAEAKRASEAEGELSSKITQTAEIIKSEVNRATEAEAQLSSKVTQTAESIKSEVSRKYETKNDSGTKYEDLSSRIAQTAENISAEVSRATSAESNLSAAININAEKIETKVEKGTVSSSISQESDTVRISADRFILESNNLEIDPDGGIISTDGIFKSAEILCNYSEGADGYPTGGLHIQRDGTTKANFISVGLGGVACKGGVHSKQDVAAEGNVTALGNVTGYYVGAGAGGIATTGTKARVVETQNFGSKTLYCYEMSNPVFGDMGRGKTDEDGCCVVFLDNIFAETINSHGCEYNVFLTPYGAGAFYVATRTTAYFVVAGEPLTDFAWEIKAKQRDYEYTRLETFSAPEEEVENLLEQSADYIQEVIAL